MWLRRLRKHRRIFASVVFIFSLLLFVRQLFTVLEAETRSSTTFTGLPLVSHARTQQYSLSSSIPPVLNHKDYPRCSEKMDWLRDHWQSHSCYAENGVNSSESTMYRYLSEVEWHCPPVEHGTTLAPTAPVAEINALTKEKIFSVMKDSQVNYAFIQSRIERLLPKWNSALNDLVKRSPEILRRRRLNIAVYMGFLSKESGVNFAQKAFSGGPLGELVQWSDLIVALFALGHRVIIHSEWKPFASAIKEAAMDAPCPDSKHRQFDLIFTDIMGLRLIKRRLKALFLTHSCVIRLLDSFGTHAEFNHASYFSKNREKFGGNKKNYWGGNNLRLKQFLTMYPHTDDNTFLGFVVELHEGDAVPRENITVVYGKEAYMWKGADEVVRAAAKFGEVHATVGDIDDAVSALKVVNHGVLSGREFHALLQKSRVFLGLGFPYEGPAPLEAVANGAVFINPMVIPPISRRSYKFFEEKPTLRELRSQNPYMERFVGPPHALTVDIHNKTALREALRNAFNSNPGPYVPAEFSFFGMLERVDVILTRQDLCHSTRKWPPFDSARVFLAGFGRSCQDECAARGFLCEPSSFPDINTSEFLSKYGSRCREFRTIAEPFAPAGCNLQAESLLFSCATVPANDVRRLCPCRTYRKENSILVS